MKWVEISKVNLPPKATIVHKVIPYQTSALLVYQKPRKGMAQAWSLGLWDLGSSFGWEVDLTGFPGLFAIENDLLLMQEPMNYWSKERVPMLYAIDLKTGTEVWREKGPFHCAAVDRGRVYTVEKTSSGPYRLITRNAASGKILRKDLAYEGYSQLTACQDLLFGNASQKMSVVTPDGEPLSESEDQFLLYTVATDGSLYTAEQDLNSKDPLTISRWEPQSKNLWRLSTKKQLVTCLLPMAASGQLLYTTQPKAQHAKLVYYDWNTNQERWSKEVKLGSYGNPTLTTTSEGFLLSTYDQKHMLFDAYTGAEKVVPLSYKGPMFASKDAILLVKGTQLLAFAWK
jgi:hypothetical protein